MGRGRAKAKQVKVARQLKYKSDDTDLDRLRAELGVGADSGNGSYDSAAGDDDEEDDDDEPPGNAEDAWKDAEDAWPRLPRSGSDAQAVEHMLTPVVIGDRDGVLAVEAGAAQLAFRQCRRFDESCQRHVAQRVRTDRGADLLG